MLPTMQKKWGWIKKIFFLMGGLRISIFMMSTTTDVLVWFKGTTFSRLFTWVGEKCGSKIYFLKNRRNFLPFKLLWAIIFFFISCPKSTILALGLHIPVTRTKYFFFPNGYPFNTQYLLQFCKYCFTHFCGSCFLKQDTELCWENL